MLLTDRQALQLIQTMRANTESVAVASLLDWVMERVAQGRDVGPATLRGANQTGEMNGYP